MQGTKSSTIWISTDKDTSQARAIMSRKNVMDGIDSLSWTPDGKLVYDSNPSGQPSIWIINADGNEPKQLTDGTTIDIQAEVAPDGRYILSDSFRSKTWQVWRMDIEGRNPKQLTEGKGIDSFSFSPDGRFVVYLLFEGWSLENLY